MVQRLEASGAIPLGKTNMNEFSSGLTGHNEHYGPVRNPWALERSPGGSSGGSAVAVAAGLCLGALGTDAGCSVRVPAAWTGVVGLRPTWGRIDLQGAFPRAPSLDAAGFLARGVADVALLSCLAMGRPAEQATETARLCLQSRRQGVSGVRVSVIEDFTFGVGDRDLDDRVASAIALMETAGCVVDAVDASWLPRLAHDDAALDLLFREFSDVMNAALGSELAGAPLGHDVRADLRLGANVSDQRYRDLLAERRRYDALVDSLFERVDIIVTPTCHFVPPRLDDGKEAFASGRFHCMPFSMLGLPAISVPIGLSDDHLPVGLQLVSARGSDDRLLTVAAALEGVLDATGDKKERTDAHGL